MEIKENVMKLVRKYYTRNPFELAAALNIRVIFEELGSINGYYNKQLRMKQIHINCNLDEHMQIYTCAHELGHATMHPNANTPFLRNQTLLSVDRLEIEANKFAVELLISDSDLKQYEEYTIDQVAQIYGYQKKLIELRIRR
mgnify:FL=1